jgi:hypothetical protein
MPVCAASRCNDETPLEGTLCAEHLEQAAAYHLVERRKRLISTGEIQERDPDIDAIIIRLHTHLNR